MLWKKGFLCLVCATSVKRVCSLLTDNVTLQIDGVLYLRVMDPYKVLSLPLGHLSPGSAHSLVSKMCAPASVFCLADGLGTLTSPKAPDSMFSARVFGRFLALALFVSPALFGVPLGIPIHSVLCFCSSGQLRGGRS